jgi:hypothetical protein
MLFAVDLHKDFIDVKGVAVTSVLSFQPAGINCPELDAPRSDSFATYSDATFCEEIFNISMAEIEAVVDSYGVTDDIWRESMTPSEFQGSDLREKYREDWSLKSV